MNDCCIACHQPLQKIELGKGVIATLVCVNPKCFRVGLLAVAGVKLVKKKKEVDNEIRTKDTNKSDGKKS